VRHALDQDMTNVLVVKVCSLCTRIHAESNVLKAFLEIPILYVSHVINQNARHVRLPPQTVFLAFIRTS